MLCFFCIIIMQTKRWRQMRGYRNKGLCNVVLVEIFSPNPNRKGSDYTSLVEARGIEPLSENLSEQLSTGVVYLFCFPQQKPINRLRPMVAF